MGWQDFLTPESEEITLPWAGGRRLHDGKRSWKIKGACPREHGWYVFSITGGREAKLVGPADGGPDPGWEEGRETRLGYLAGGRAP